MIRSRALAQTKLVTRGFLRQTQPLPQSRFSSSGSSGGGGLGKVALTGFVAVAGVAGGTLGYATYDPEFRSYVEDMVPGAREAFATVLGEEEKKVVPKKPVPAVVASPSKLKPPPVKVTAPPPKEEAKAPPVLPPPPLPELIPPPELEVPSPKTVPELEQVSEQVSDPTPAEKEDPAVAANAELEGLLDDACRTMESIAEMAIVAGMSCTDSLRRHMTLVQRVLETNATGGEKDENAWNQVFDAAALKTEASRRANAAMMEAKASIKKVLEAIETAKNNAITSANPILQTADEKVNKVLIQLEKIRVSMETVHKEALAVDRYRDLIEEGRQQFQREIAAILPHLNLGQKDGFHLTEEELNLFLTHAYQKVCALQQELAKWKTLENERSEQMIRSTMATEEVVQTELSRQRRELEVEYHRRMAALRDEMENEMRCQLRRQAAAHADHISDVLEVQEKELSRIYARTIDEAVTSEKSAYQDELAKVLGKVYALEKSVDDRAAMDQATSEAQALWLASVSMGLALNNEDVASVSLEKEVKNLSKNFSSDEYVAAILKGIPKEAVSGGGVPTEAAIKDRFFKVEQLAKRTALVGDEGGSLFRYAVSFLQSFFVLSPARETMPDKNIPIDIEALSTFDIVWLARGSIERGDLEQAVKYMSLLKGEPGNLSRDWIKDAHVLLETQLACKALIAHAASVGSEVYPVKDN